ncbi:MAG TPA: hypothetical protein VHQ20_00755 [Patescibacteria group bacterium]|nr:hypothetical protein [Patescibacteria group bacterium]
MPSLYTEIKSNDPNTQGINRRWVIIIVASAVVLLLIFGALLWRSQHQLNKVKKDLQTQQNTPASKAASETKDLVAKVGKLIILPANEEPTIATVTDLDKLKGQAFFDKAQLGDKVLIYTQAQKAILYRPETNQIIELAPLLNGTNTPAAPTNATP